MEDARLHIQLFRSQHMLLLIRLCCKACQNISWVTYIEVAAYFHMYVYTGEHEGFGCMFPAIKDKTTLPSDRSI